MSCHLPRNMRRLVIAVTAGLCATTLVPAQAYAVDQPTCSALRDVLVGGNMVSPGLTTTYDELLAKLSRQSREQLAVAAFALGRKVAPDADKKALANEVAGTALECRLVVKPTPTGPASGSSIGDFIAKIQTSPDPIATVVDMIAAGSSGPRP